MKIAVPVTSDNQIDSHFGHCDSFEDLQRIIEPKLNTILQ